MSQKKNRTEKKQKEVDVFRRFDIEFLGRVHVRMLPAMITLPRARGGLGLHFSGYRLKSLVQKYDSNPDHSLDKEEFTLLMRDRFVVESALHQSKAVRKRFQNAAKHINHLDL